MENNWNKKKTDFSKHPKVCWGEQLSSQLLLSVKLNIYYESSAHMDNAWWQMLSRFVVSSPMTVGSNGHDQKRQHNAHRFDQRGQCMYCSEMMSFVWFVSFYTYNHVTTHTHMQFRTGPELDSFISYTFAKQPEPFVFVGPLLWTKLSRWLHWKQFSV